MPKQKRERSGPPQEPNGRNLSAIDNLVDAPTRAGFIGYMRTHSLGIGAVILVLLLGLGVMAKNGWLPHTDALTGKRTGWFGREVPKNAPRSWNPLAFSDPTPTPQLSKEYIYAGSRLLAVEDANASAIPPEDLAVWRPSTGIWYVLGGQGSQQQSYPWGQNGDDPVEGDYDGDGKTDFSVFRPSEDRWYIVKSSDGTWYNVSFGNSSLGDKMAQADFDSDGKTDIAVWRPCTSGTCVWYILPSSTGVMYYYSFGSQGDTPIPADFDGDGRADVALWRNSDHTVNSVNSSNGQTVSVSIGAMGDTPVCADYDGDGKTNYAVKRGADWIIMNAALTSTTTTQWQTSGGVAVPNDYDGDGIVDIAVWKVPGGIGGGNNCYWYIRQSGDNFSTRTVQWGVSTDIPVPAFYRR